MILNIEAEENLLGSLIVKNDLICEIDINAEDFYREQHKVIYSAIMGLYSEGKPIDITTLCEKLNIDLAKVGGITYISELASCSVPNVTNVKSYAEIIKEKSNLRKLQTLLKTSLKEIEGENTNSDKIISKLQASTLQTDDVKILTDDQVMEKTLNMIQDNYKNGGGIIGLRTGISDLDEAINGLQKGKLIIIAGRPGMCKSAVALNIKQNISNHRGVFFSLEMGEEELGIRCLAMKSSVDSAKIERGAMTPDEWAKITQISSRIALGKSWTDTYARTSITRIRKVCRKMQLTGGIEYIIVDYLQIMNTKGLGDSRAEEIAALSKELKALAKEFEIPVIALAQLNRGCEQRADKRPLLSDLKESGGIEENADIVMLLYRDEYYNKDTEEPGTLEVNVAKQRNGRTGMFKLKWIPQYQRIERR